jgi:hypothetical protein
VLSFLMEFELFCTKNVITAGHVAPPMSEESNILDPFPTGPPNYRACIRSFSLITNHLADRCHCDNILNMLFDPPSVLLTASPHAFENDDPVGRLVEGSSHPCLPLAPLALSPALHVCGDTPLSSMTGRDQLDTVGRVLETSGLWIYAARLAAPSQALYPHLQHLISFGPHRMARSSKAPNRVRGQIVRSLEGQSFALFAKRPTGYRWPIWLYEQLVRPRGGQGGQAWLWV